MAEKFVYVPPVEENLPSHELLGTQPIILLSGAMASGKETGANFLEETYGFSHITISDILKSEAVRRGIHPPFLRENLREIAQELVEDGPDLMIQQLAEQVHTLSAADNYRGTIIDGLRIPSVSSVLSREKNIAGIWVEASPEVRKERFIGRGASPEQVAEFDEADRIENEAMAPIREISHYIVTNDGSCEKFFSDLDVIVHYRFGISPLDSRPRTIYP
jgi:dephospho-CoA kinase